MRKLFTLAMLALTVAANAQWARIYTTTPDRKSNIAPSVIESASASNPNITIDTDTRYQSIDGYGYAITYAACYNLMNMPSALREELLKRTFSPTEGYGSSYVRISIGCNDFSSTEYSLCDTKGPSGDLLRDFSLHPDELNYVIPILQRIKEYNPGIKIMAAPWTPPRWMKTKNSWTDGELSSAYYDAYGEYFVKFINAFKSHGLDIYAVTPQNEPMNRGNSASCYMTWATQADFISTSLAPKIKNAGLNTRIYLWDHNYNYDNISDQEDFPYKAFQRMGTNFTGYELVEGTAWHKYTGYDDDWKEMIDIYQKTGKDNLFTEASIGTWNAGDDLNQSLARDMRDLVIHPSLGYSRGSLIWNFALDTNRAPNRPGGCQTCFGAITVTTDGQSYSYNSHYYIMAMASAAVKPGAHRVNATGSINENVTYSAFVNPDGTVGVLLANNSGTGRNAIISFGGKTYRVMVPAKGVVTALLGLTESDAKDGIVTIPGEGEQGGRNELESNPRYLSGTFNNWTRPGSSGSYRMLVDGDRYYYTVRFSGEGRFCVYGDNWNPKYCKVTADDPMITGPVIDMPLRLADDSDGEPTDLNYSLNGDYRVEFNPATLTLSVIDPSSGVELTTADGTDEAPAYYNMMGARVDNPGPGIYIRVAGSKISKVVIK